MTEWLVILLAVLVLILVIVAVRIWLLKREVAPPAGIELEGSVYRVGDAAVIDYSAASADDPERQTRPLSTVICMHGFVENAAYFLPYYDQQQVQFIGIVSAGYHLPVASPKFVDADWATTPDEVAGSIEYDAAVLVKALANLPRSRSIRVHGHSRGGAVVLDAARQRPDLFSDVEVILEAPVLPQSRPVNAISPAALWLISFFVPLWRHKPISRRNRGAWGALEDEKKRVLIEQLPFNPRRTEVMVANLRSMNSWMTQHDASIFANLTRAVILIPSKDKILDPSAMTESAKRAEGERLSIIEVEGCSHFVLLDRPDMIPALAGAGQKE